MPSKKLTPQERARLGGLARAHKYSSEELKRLAAIGGRATFNKHGAAHMTKMALRRHGREVTL